ncbi:MAG: T9SS type A sorting domain-containing protein [candidate division WOR-3 bacterium]
MLNIVLSVLLAGIPVLPRPHEDVTLDPGKIEPGQPPSVIICQQPTGGGWRPVIMSGEAHNNLLWLEPGKLAFLGSDVAGTNWEGASVWYSEDNGSTWTKYNINATVINRVYPDAFIDRTTGTPWYAYQIRVPGTASKIYVAKDEGAGIGAPGIFSEYQVTAGEGTYGEWLPTVVAKGDTVVVSYMKYDLGVGACKTSFDGGETWGDEVIIDENQAIDNPNLIFVEPNTLVFFSFDGDIIDTIIFWKSTDWGQTWSGPFKLESSAVQYGFASWWYSYVGVAYQGKVHVLAVLSPSGIENGILYDYIYDPATDEITEEFVVGYVYFDTTSNAWRVGIPQARTPSVGVTQDGSKLVAMFMNYDESGSYKDPYFMVYDGNSWSDYAPVFAVADTFDEGRGDFCPTVYDDGEYLNLFFVCSSGSVSYANIYYAGAQVLIPSVNEARPFSTLNVKPTLVTRNFNIEFAVSKLAEVEVSVYNTAGQKVANLYRGTLNAGSHRLTFDANFGKGIYFVTVTVDGKSTSRKILVK